MKHLKTEANNKTQSVTNAKTQCSNLNTTVMHKHQNIKINSYLPFVRLLLISYRWKKSYHSHL